MANQDKLEEEVLQVLTEGDMDVHDPSETARKLLPPQYEIRMKTDYDPIVKETELYRQMAEELDERYGPYTKKQR